MKIRLFKSCIPLAVLCLAACSGAPGSSVVEDTVRQLQEAEFKKLEKGGLLGGLAQAGGYRGGEVTSVEKVGCDEAGQNVYNCTVIVEVVLRCEEGSLVGMTNECDRPTRKTVSYRFLKSSKGWEVQPAS